MSSSLTSSQVKAAAALFNDSVAFATYTGPMEVQNYRPSTGSPVHRTSAPRLQQPEPPPEREENFGDGWVGAAISLGGGALALAGGLKGEPLMVAGGALLTAVGTGMTAHRIKNFAGMDAAAKTAFVGGGVLTAAGALLLFHQPPPQAPDGPLPQLIERLGLRGL